MTTSLIGRSPGARGALMVFDNSTAGLSCPAAVLFSMSKVAISVGAFNLRNS
jgi:hypothetical protein